MPPKLAAWLSNARTPYRSICFVADGVGGYVAFAAEFGREVARVTASTVAEATEKLERELP